MTIQMLKGLAHRFPNDFSFGVTLAKTSAFRG